MNPKLDIALIVPGGDAPTVLPTAVLGQDIWVIGVDSGIEHALALGLPVHQAIGDFDSVNPSLLEQVQQSGAIIEQYPVAKNATDFELALDAALVYAPKQILVLGGHGGRIDHFLANAFLLTSPRYASVPITAFMGDAVLTVIRDRAKLHGVPGQLISLLPMHGPALGVHTVGLKYRLHRETLEAHSSRGVSNEFITDLAEVRLAHGVLLAIQSGYASS